MALDAKLRIQQARTQRYANYDKKRKDMVEELEEAERAAAASKSAEAKKKQKYAQEAEQIRDAGRRMVEERQAELRRQQEEAERAEKSAQEELEPPPLGAYLPLVPIHAKLIFHRYPRRTRYDRSRQIHASQVSPANDARCIANVHERHLRARRRRLDRALHEIAKKESDRGGPVQDDI